MASEQRESLKAISVEELEEQAEEVGFLTPRELAKMLGTHPQQVYSWIRKGVFPSERCKCGRTVVNVALAKAALVRKARELGRFVKPEDDPRYQAVAEKADDEFDPIDPVCSRPLSEHMYKYVWGASEDEMICPVDGPG